MPDLMIAYRKPKVVHAAGFCSIKYKLRSMDPVVHVAVLHCSIYLVCQVLKILHTHLATTWAPLNFIRLVPVRISALESVVCKSCYFLKLSRG